MLLVKFICRRLFLVAGVLPVMMCLPPCFAWLDGPADVGGGTSGLAAAWRLDPAMEKSHFSQNASMRVVLFRTTVPANILHPGEQAILSVQLINRTKVPIDQAAKLDVIRYEMKTPGDSPFKQQVDRLSEEAGPSVLLHVAPGGFQNIELAPSISQTFGGYAVILDAGPLGRFFVAGMTRTLMPDSRPVQYPQFSLDQMDPVYLERMGIKAIRLGVGYKPTTDADFAAWYETQSAKLRDCQKHHVTVMLTVWWGAQTGPLQPLGRPRPKLNDDGVMQPKAGKPDVAWLPKYDPDVQQWCKKFASDFGWPKGPVTGFALWNEPWEGGSVDYWGADVLRFREIFTAMAKGVVEARESAHVNVLICGCDSTSNTMDKLFSDGKDDFLKYLDVCTVHYQGMAVPTLYKAWNNRPQGRVKVWDTESWTANSDDRIAAAAAGTFSAGQNRMLGVFHGRVIEEADVPVRVAGHKPQKVKVAQTFSVAAAEVAADTLIGERTFKELLFRNGLPFVMSFEGGPEANFYSPDDGTLVVVGDLGPTFGHDNQVFRTVETLGNRRTIDALDLQLNSGALDAAHRTALAARIEQLRTRSGATMTLADHGGTFRLLDFYGNRLLPEAGMLTIPLDGRGFFLRTDGSAGSFQDLKAAVRASRIDGLEPVEIKAHDLLARIERKPPLVVTLTNVLNRPVEGRITATLGKLQLQLPGDPVKLSAGETRDVPLAVIGGTATPENAYPLHLTFDAGTADGSASLDELMHVNVIPKRTITVDGRLDDWAGIPGQTITDAGEAAPSITETAWFSTVQKFSPTQAGGLATGYLAYDDTNFYFAAKIADDSQDPGTRRFATIDDDDFFYPEISYDVKNGKKIEYHWPAGVRRYSYRMRYELPCGNAPQHDNVQIAFHVLGPGEGDMEAYPPGTMPHYIAYRCTDHEFALNKVADKYGGGTEIWKIYMPGMPQKQYFPREPKSPMDGPLPGTLVTTHDGNTRITEVAIPWTAIPLVKKKLDAGEPIKFSFRVNDNTRGGTMELARGRSVSKINMLAFQAHWKEHWANEVQFAFEK